MKHMTAVMIVMTAIVLASAAFTTISLKREVNRLEPKAKKYDEICGGVRGALRTDITLLHDTDNPAWMTPKQVEDDRRALYRRVGSTVGGDDSYVMLQRCMPSPFPMEAWRSCDNDVCLRAILQQAHDSIPL